jgi:hypothetical protein
VADRDNLTPALTQTWNRRLADFGFRRVGRRDLQCLSGGIVRLFNFQISTRGSGDFCINVAAFTLSGNDTPVLEPGFRLRNPDGSDMWLPSKSAQAAADSAGIAWNAAEAQALPWLERNSTPQGHLQVLRAETWVSRPHLAFQIGVVEAMLGRREEAIGNLIAASRLYAEDGRNWCLPYIAKAEALIDALHRSTERRLLEQWCTANLSVHRIKQR